MVLKTGTLHGPARASTRIGRIEVPIIVDGKPCTVHIPRWQVRRLIDQLSRAERSANRIKELKAV